jgi:hypothetical protein
MIWLTNLYGGIGAAVVWLAVNAGAVIISVPIIHKKILQGQTFRWYVNDNLIPLALAVFICVASYLVYNNYFGNPGLNYFTCLVVFGIPSVFTFLQFPHIKTYLFNFLRNRKF